MRDGRADRRLRQGARAGMSLLEILVVMAVMAVVVAIGLPSLQSIFDIQQRGAARELAMTYKYLRAEAAMRNVTFRIAYNLDTRSYRIEVGEPGTLVFSDPSERDAVERADREKMRGKSKAADGPTEITDEEPTRFTGLDMPGFQTAVELPPDTVFAWVWTPQYPEAQTPSEEPPESDEDQRIVYSYVFANGEAEHTVVRIADSGDAEDGYTVEVEPLSGVVSVDSEIREIGASMAWLPSEAPTIR
jgi:prepilin-type N-terminal cleavage/methylation domain-containing protein